MPKPKMQLFVIDGKSLFRDENNADEEHFAKADHRERYDQETLRQKVELSKQSRRATGKEIMDADAEERELRGNIREAIVGREAEEHIDFHIAAMYREETYQLSMKVARLVAEREGLHCSERSEFLSDEANAAVERLNILQEMGTDN
jgi:hypothetical protein